MKAYKIIKDHKSSFPDPIILKKGEKVFVGQEYSEDPDWPGWIECKTKSGKKGWVPKQYLKISRDAATVLCDYNANELNVKAGEEVMVYEFVNGWAWSKKSTGEYGWIPVRNIETKQ
jgi:hypothetical protein